MKYQVDDLEFLWISLMKRRGVSREDAATLFDQISEAYGHYDRHYHNLRHIASVLSQLDDLIEISAVTNPDTIRLAAWYHDIVYHSQAQDNEERSAWLAESSLRKVGLPRRTYLRVGALILVTKKHLADPSDIQSHILLDADLAILGSSSSEYDHYSRSIRKEYGWVPDETYYPSRAQVLQSFLDRKRIYHTEYAFGNFEHAARLNLSNELALIAWYTKKG